MDVNLRVLKPFAWNSIPNRNVCGQKRWAIDHFREGERCPTCIVGQYLPQKVVWVKVGRAPKKVEQMPVQNIKQTAFLILEKILSRLVSIRIHTTDPSGATAADACTFRCNVKRPRILNRHTWSRRKQPESLFQKQAGEKSH
jgi:hypothetical protein